MPVTEKRVTPPEDQPDPVRWLFTRGASFSAASAVRAVSALLVLPLMTRVLGVSDLGEVSVAVAVTGVVGSVASLGLHSASNREYFGSGPGDRQPALARRLGLAAVLAACATAVVLLLTGGAWAPIVSDGFGWSLAIATTTAIPIVLMVVSQNLLRAEDRPAAFVATTAIATVIGPLVGLALAAAVADSPLGYLVGLLVGFCGAGAVGAGLVRLGGQLPTRAELTSGLRLGLPTVAHSLGVYLLAVGDRAVVASVDGFSAVGRYQVSYLVGSVGILLVQALNLAWGPLVFGAGDRSRADALAGTSAAVQRLLGVVVLAVCAGAPFVLRFVAPASYDLEGLEDVVSIIAPAAVVYGMYQAASFVLFQSRRTGPLAVLSIVAATANLVANLVLVPRWGLVGAAVATTGSYASWAFGARMLVRREGSVRWRRAEEVRALLTAALAVALGVGLPVDGWGIAVRVGVLGCAGAVALRTLLGYVRGGRPLR